LAEATNGLWTAECLTGDSSIGADDNGIVVKSSVRRYSNATINLGAFHSHDFVSFALILWLRDK
jgi:hypothetical protein